MVINPLPRRSLALFPGIEPHRTNLLSQPDITWPLNATCLVGNISFYQRLVGVTLGPLILLAFLSVTYAVAMRVHPRGGGGRGGESTEARQRAVMRHASAALLVLFLVSCLVAQSELAPPPPPLSCYPSRRSKLWRLRVSVTLLVVFSLRVYSARSPS